MLHLRYHFAVSDEDEEKESNWQVQVAGEGILIVHLTFCPAVLVVLDLAVGSRLWILFLWANCSVWRNSQWECTVQPVWHLSCHRCPNGQRYVKTELEATEDKSPPCTQLPFSLFSGRLPGWSTFQHNCQTLQLGNSLLGSGGDLHSQHCGLFLSEKYPYQNGSCAKENWLKGRRTWLQRSLLDPQLELQKGKKAALSRFTACLYKVVAKSHLVVTASSHPSKPNECP